MIYNIHQVAVLGASGYTGAELVRLLSGHQQVDISVLTAERNAGQDFKTIFPQFSYRKELPKLSKWEDSRREIDACDIVFCCLPHGTTQEIISKILLDNRKTKIVDLSADFRLSNVNTYEKWYGKKHLAAALQLEAVYGLVEVSLYLFIFGSIFLLRFTGNAQFLPVR